MATTVSRIFGAADQEAEVRRQAAKMAAVQECEDLNEFAQQSVKGIIASCGELCRRPSTLSAARHHCMYGNLDSLMNTQVHGIHDILEIPLQLALK